MSLSIGSNRDSLHAQTNLARTTKALSKSFERLSSGLRINSASDDAAGLALADKLRSDSRLVSVAIRNADDGISITSIADGSLTEINSMLQRMSELATQSANGTYTTSQRSSLSYEFLALGSEIDRISKNTSFNNMQLLSNSSSITLQVGLDNSTNSQITLTAVLGTLSSLGLASSGSSALSYSIISVTESASTLAATNALSAVQLALNTLTTTRGTVGAATSRLSSAVDYLQVVRENFVAAESKIRDVDVAEEVAKMTSLQVLQQAGTAVLAQANQNPSLILKLLS